MATRISESVPAAALQSPSVEARTSSLELLKAEEQAREGIGSESALLLNEQARLHEGRDDLAAAARDALAATKADGTFIEPLEALIGVAIRSRSKGNLLKLLGRLGKLASEPDERLHAALALVQTNLTNGDLDEAQKNLEQALQQLPDSAALWLLLEDLAARKRDPTLLLRASLGRSAHARSPELRSLLLGRVARLQFESQDSEAAFDSLSQGFDEVPTWRALRTWEAMSVVDKNFLQARKAATKTAALISAALDEPEEAELFQIPGSELHLVRMLAAQVRAIIYGALDENWQEAAQLSARLLEGAPDSHLAQVLRGEFAHRAGESHLRAASYRNILGHGLAPRTEAPDSPSNGLTFPPEAQAPLSSEEAVYAATYLSLAARKTGEVELENRAKTTLARAESRSWIQFFVHLDELCSDTTASLTQRGEELWKLLSEQLERDQSGYFDDDARSPHAALPRAAADHLELTICRAFARLFSLELDGPTKEEQLAQLAGELAQLSEEAARLARDVSPLPDVARETYEYLLARLGKNAEKEAKLLQSRIAQLAVADGRDDEDYAEADEREVQRRALGTDLVRVVASSAVLLTSSELQELGRLLDDDWLPLALRLATGDDPSSELESFARAPGTSGDAEASSPRRASWSVLKENPQWPRVVDTLHLCSTRRGQHVRWSTPATDAFRIGLELGQASLLQTGDSSAPEREAPLLGALERGARHIGDSDLQAGWRLQLGLRLMQRGHHPQALRVLEELKAHSPSAVQSLRPWMAAFSFSGDASRLHELAHHNFENNDRPDQPLLSQLSLLCLKARHDKQDFAEQLLDVAQGLDTLEQSQEHAALKLACSLWIRDEAAARPLLDWRGSSISTDKQLLSPSQRLLLLAALDDLTDDDELRYRVEYARHRSSRLADLAVWVLSRRADDRTEQHSALLRLALREESLPLALYTNPEYLDHEARDTRQTFILRQATDATLPSEQRKLAALGQFQHQNEDSFEADATRFARIAEALSRKEEDEEKFVDPNQQLAALCAGVRFAQADKYEDALLCLEPLVEELPSDPALCGVLRLVAEKTGRPDLEAHCTVELAKLEKKTQRSSDLWERAGFLYQDILDDEQRAEECFNAALVHVPGRPLSFERLYRIAKQKGDRPRQVELLNARLVTAESRDLKVELLWEKARYCRMLGNRSASLRSTIELLRIDPTHLPSMALAAELHLVNEHWEDAALSLRDVAMHPSVEEEQRRSAGLHAADLFEKVGRPRDAVELIENLKELGLSDQNAQEKQARALARTEDWGAAYAAFKDLNEKEDSIDKRIESAQMMLAIQRDHLRQPADLREAVRRVLRDAPLDADALEVALRVGLDQEDKKHLLQAAREESRSQLRRDPLNQSEIKRLSELCHEGGDDELERVALGTRALLGTLPSALAARLQTLAEAINDQPREAWTQNELATILPEELASPVAVFAQILGRRLTLELEADLEARGVNGMMRFDEFSGNPVREEIAPWATALGISDFELFVGGRDSESISGLQLDLPTLIVGKNVELPFGLQERARLVSLLVAMKAGLCVYASQPTEITTLWLRAAVDVADPSAQESPALVDELSREEQEIRSHLNEHLTAEEKAELKEILDEVGSARESVFTLPSAVQKAGLRLAAIITGDPSIVRALPDLIPADEQERAQAMGDLIDFCLSNEFRAARQKARLS